MRVSVGVVHPGSLRRILRTSHSMHCLLSVTLKKKMVRILWISKKRKTSRRMAINTIYRTRQLVKVPLPMPSQSVLSQITIPVWKLICLNASYLSAKWMWSRIRLQIWDLFHWSSWISSSAKILTMDWILIHGWGWCHRRCSWQDSHGSKTTCSSALKKFWSTRRTILTSNCTAMKRKILQIEQKINRLDLLERLHLNSMLRPTET